MKLRRDQYRKWYELGWTYAEIARKFNVTESTVKLSLTYEEKQKSKGYH
jgi:DNA-directed RNA polymerase specialized sigma24 family protein